MGITWSTTGRESQASPQEGVRTGGIRSRAQWMWTVRDSVPPRPGGAGTVRPRRRESRAGAGSARCVVGYRSRGLGYVGSVLPGRACGYVRTWRVACVGGGALSRPSGASVLEEEVSHSRRLTPRCSDRLSASGRRKIVRGKGTRSQFHRLSMRSTLVVLLGAPMGRGMRLPNIFSGLSSPNAAALVDKAPSWSDLSKMLADASTPEEVCASSPFQRGGSSSCPS